MLQKTPKVKREKTIEEALASLMRLCARAERSSGDALRLMNNWGIKKEVQNSILQRLTSERFIDDKRYAEAFVREKMALSAWGRYKIIAALKRKGICSDIIEEALTAMQPSDNRKRLQERLQSKIRHIKYDTPYQLKTKLMRYALSLGFDMEDAIESVNEVIKSNNIEECDD